MSTDKLKSSPITRHLESEHSFIRRIRPTSQSVILGTVLAIHGLLLGWISVSNAPVFDEIGHLPAGLAHWQLGNFDLYRVNPPLMRMIASVPLLMANPKTDWDSVSNSPYARSEFIVGKAFMKANGFDSFWLFTICRWAQIPVSIFGAWVCFCWARELYGVSSGYIALILWCFCPNILGWGSTLTPDMGAAAFGAAAAYTFWRWLKSPTWGTAMLAGVAMGLAELSKTTWILLFLLWPVLWGFWRYCVRNSQAPINHTAFNPITPVLSAHETNAKAWRFFEFLRVRGRTTPVPLASQLVCILLIAIYLLNFGYGFEGSFHKLGQFRFISRALGGPDAHTSPGNRFRDSFLQSIPVPLPANYVKGIDVQKYDFEKGKWSYLRGEQKFGGWWYYYVYALVVKTPLGTLFLFGMACMLGALWRCRTTCNRDEIVLIIPAIAVLVLVSSQSGFNRYLRYVLPAIPFLYIFASRVGVAFVTRKWVLKLLCVIAMVASVAETLSTYPYSMSFFNSASGGSLGGPRHLLDANIDWGQDLLALKHFVDQHPEVSPIYLGYFGYADPKLAEFAFEPIAIPPNDEPLFDLKPGWYAISVNYLYGYRHYKKDNPIYTCFHQYTPIATVGYSIYIYHLTDDEIAVVAKPQL